MNMCDLGFGTLLSRIFKGLVSHCLAAGNENVGFQAAKLVSRAVSHYLAATGHQKIQPQEMRIWGLGLRNCFREFSGTCVPLSGRSRPPKIQPEEMRIWGWARKIVLGSLQGLASPYLAAAGHQKSSHRK